MSKITNASQRAPATDSLPQKPTQTASSKTAKSPSVSDVWEAGDLSSCVSASSKRANAESAALQKQVKRASLAAKICDTLLAGGLLGTFCTVTLGLAASWLVPCAALVFTMVLVLRAELQSDLHDKELKLARKQGEAAMSQEVLAHIPAFRQADALKAPSKAA